ncbi:MAG: tRNA (N(6)-L-threonylcarbamoyladenosine(37)-C(2))-methylthiotransferase MtaB [Desulforhopalus sp.]
MKKVLITTLGCKVNQYESASFKTGFEDRGLSVVTGSEPADIVVINTCAVTAGAGSQSRKAIRQGLRRNPTAQVVITGCYAELAASEIAEEKALGGRSVVIIGNSKKDQLVSTVLEAKTCGKELNLGTISEAREICRLPVRRFGERVRAYLRIQDGCENFCSYCIVPYTRGPSRSLPVAEVVEQAKIFCDEGHREIVLTGIHLGNYGKDLSPAVDFVTLLETLTVATPEVFYRISSLEPLEISKELLTLMQTRNNIQPHLHIPLQSGHDRILSRMNRGYTTEQFREVINLCRDYLPDGAIGIDILAGFPGETDAYFAAAMSYLRSIYFTYLHVFPYSVRPGTKAARFGNQVPKNIKEQRAAALRCLSDDRRTLFYASHLSQTRPVFVEGARDNHGLLKGFTDNYIAVRFTGPDTLLDSVAAVKLLHVQDNYVLGKWMDHYES